MLISGLLGHMMMASERRTASAIPGAGFADSMFSKRMPVTCRLGAAFDQVFLKMHLAFGGDDRRGRWVSVIGRMRDLTPSAVRSRSAISSGRPCLSCCARKMCAARSRSPRLNQRSVCV